MSKAGRFTQQPPATVRSTVTVPEGACDCHGHIFPDPALYPTFDTSMPMAPIEMFLDVHAQLGFDRAVVVQGGAYRFDNRAMLDALGRHPDTLRGVALLTPDTPEDVLASHAARNVRALRFTAAGASGIETFAPMAPVMRELGLHAELFLGLDGFLARERELLATGVPLVLDHLAGPFDPTRDAAGFDRLLGVLSAHDVWVKLTPQRNSQRYPDYADVRPFHDALVAARPDRLVWGSDWPFPNMSEATPDLGDLLTLFGEWVTDPDLRHRILVDNPTRLYWADD